MVSVKAFIADNRSLQYMRLACMSAYLACRTHELQKALTIMIATVTQLHMSSKSESQCSCSSSLNSRHLECDRYVCACLSQGTTQTSVTQGTCLMPIPHHLAEGPVRASWLPILGQIAY